MVRKLRDLTVLLTCKNREYNLKYCLGSIHGCNPRPNTILIDYGSDVSLISYSEKYPWLKVIRVDRNTKTFHKTRAYNIGLRQVKTKFMCATDIDQIFQSNFFGVVYFALSSTTNAFVMCKTRFLKRSLPKDINPTNISKNYSRIKNLIPKDSRIGGEGCCLAISTKWAMSVNGWDEGYIGRGPEDSDFMVRARLANYKHIWLSLKKTGMIHLPHKDKMGFVGKYKKLNKERYFNRKKNTKQIIVNLNKQWGQL
jgi:hypothetical protein